MRKGVGVIAAALASLICSTGLAAQPAFEPNPKIETAYLPPKSQKFSTVYERMKSRAILEHLSIFLSPLNLPSVLKIRTDECGALTRVYTRQEGITICYEFIEEIKRAATKVSIKTGGIRAFGREINDTVMQLAKKEAAIKKELDALPEGNEKEQIKGALKDIVEEKQWFVKFRDSLKVDAKGNMTPANARRILIAGAVLQSSFYRVALGLLDIYNVPVWGRYTDAADRLAAFTMLQLYNDNRVPIVGFYGGEAFFIASDRTWTGSDFAAIRSPTTQRRFNYLCMAYGANPELFASFQPVLQRRAVRCADEYKKASRAFYTVISPHIDEEKALRVQSMPIFLDDDF